VFKIAEIPARMGVMSEAKDVSLRSLSKICVLGFLVLLDIALNSSLDHDDYEHLGLGDNVLFLTLGIQVRHFVQVFAVGAFSSTV
jgi:hypothetical protein